MLQKRNQSGRTMVEMLAVLAVIGVLTVGAIAGLSQAMDKYRISKTHDDILSISQAIVDLYAWQRRYPTFSGKTAEMCKNKVFPDGCTTGYVAKNVYGGNYQVSNETNDQSVIVITATGVPSSACTALTNGEMDWGDFLVVDGNKQNPTCSGTTFTIKFY